jgi:toluene monooxygenase electron transfer component
MAQIQVSTATGAIRFECRESERILHAGLRQGIGLPYECGSGTCGKCKADILAGAVTDLWPEAPAKKGLKAGANEILMCQSSACGFVDISVSRLSPPGQRGLCRPSHVGGAVGGVRRLNREVMELTIGLDRPIEFAAGQFVLVEFPGVRGHRAYSMVNYGSPARELCLVVRRKLAGRASDWLFDGDPMAERVSIFGPLGKATFEPGSMRDILCVAGGSGIAGMMSIARGALATHHLVAHRMEIFFGVRRADDLFYADELSELRARAPDALGVTVALSEEPAARELRERHPLLGFEQGFVHEVAIRKARGRLDNATAFLAGPPVAVDAGIRGLMGEMKIPFDRIRFDRFS